MKYFIITYHYERIFKIMRLSFLFIFLIHIQLAAVGYSQSINLDVSNMEIRQVIKNIEQQSDYRFFYTDGLSDLNRKVSLNLSDQNINQVLALLFDDTQLGYLLVNDKVIMLAPKEALQQITVTGTVTDKGGSLPGVNVMVKGTTIGTSTDADGRYTITFPDENAVLQFTYVGLIPQEVIVGTQKIINVNLIEDTRMMEEVVVIGYGTQRKGEVSSAVATIKSDKFLQGNPTNIYDQIRGQLAGLSIVRTDANPTSGPQIMLRGISTLRGNSSPLVLVDGIPGVPVSPEQVEQIDVLKDGSAAAIYGTRTSNGVILITTKQTTGEVPTTVDVNAYVETQRIVKRLPYMTAEQYREKVQQGVPGAVDYGASTNWLDEILQTPLTQVYSISLKGGSRNTNYVAAVERHDMNGIIKRSDNQMIMPRIYITHQMFNGMLKLSGNISGVHQSYYSGMTDGNSFNTSNQSSPYRSALTYNPTAPIKDADGNWFEILGNNELANPVAYLKEIEGNVQTNTMAAFGTVSLTPITGLNIKYMISTNLYNMQRGYFETSNYVDSKRYGRTGYAQNGSSRANTDIQEFTVNYSKTVAKDHTFTLLGGHSWYRYNAMSQAMVNYNFPSDEYTYNNIGAGTMLAAGRASMSSSQSENKLIAYFGRLNYSYQGKYMLSASVRYEGSTRFGTNNKWGTFPAVSAAWNVKGEKFAEGLTWLNTLKLRAGYGVTGTEPASSYMSLNTLSITNTGYYDGEWTQMIMPASNYNPDLKWELKAETNVGLDFGFINNRIYGSIDWYYRKTSDMIWSYSVPSPPYIYTSVNANAATLMNRGIELSLNGIIVKTNDWQWISSVNYSTNKNEMISFSNDKFIFSTYSDQGSIVASVPYATHRLEEGKPIGNFFGYKSIGVDDSGYWIIEDEDGNPKSIKTLTPADRKVLGNGIPQFYLNWNNTVSYKNFDLTLAMRGAFKFQIMNMTDLVYAIPVMIASGNIPSYSFDKKYGKELAYDQEQQYVSYFIEDGDYWKIDHLTLGYNFVFTNSFIRRARLYGSVDNLAVITGYSGIDPEVPVLGLTPGIEHRLRYPRTRTFSIGVSLNF